MSRLLFIRHFTMWYLVGIIVLSFCYESLAYNAAVVDYHPEVGSTPMSTITKNLENYGTLIQEAASHQTDIIVFPEYGLTTMVENPENYSLKFDFDNPVLQRISNLAKQNQIYVVVNLLEKQETEKTAEYYNTNLVFDRNGTIIAKYRKINLFGEPNLTAGSPTQKVTFQTDFDITFGTFTCFDILYTNPSRTILDGTDVMDIVYPTSWFSTMPFYVSLSVQHSYAISSGVNFLASNLNEPENTHGGSGIYLADGTSKIYISDTSKTKLIVKTVPKRRLKKNKTICRITMPPRSSIEVPPNNLSDYKTLRDFNASNYIFKTVDLSQKNVQSSICHKKFCCHFNINVKQYGTGDIYKLMAFDGIVPFDVSTAHIRVCSLLACENDSNDSCGTRVKTSTKFSNIVTTSTFVKESGSFVNPLTLDYYLRPMRETNFCENEDEDEDKDKMKYQLHTTYHENENVLVYGLFQRIESK